MNKFLLKKYEIELNKKINTNKSFELNKFDSLDIMTIISIFEDHYNIRVKDNVLKKMKSFSDLEKIINKK